MKVFFVILNLCTFLFAGASFAAGTRDVKDMVADLCQSYHGEEFSELLEGSSGLIRNPLLATSTGRQILKGSFKNAFGAYDYFNSHEIIQEILNSDDFQASADRCYGNNEMAKIRFVFLLQKLDVDGKSFAALVEGMINFTEGMAFLKASAWIAGKLTFLKSVMVWVNRALLAAAVLTAGKVAYLFVQYKRGKYKRAQATLDPKLIEAARLGLQDAEQGAREAIVDLEKQAIDFQKTVDAETNPNEKAKKRALLEETIQLIYQLKSELKAN